jgi:hypothetical protein
VEQDYRLQSGRYDPGRLFFIFSACFLAVTGIAKLYSATGTAKLLSQSDEFLHVNLRLLMIATGVVELLLAAYLSLGSNNRAKAIALLWLSSNFILYRFANSLLGIEYCPCLGTLGQKLPISQGNLNALLTAAVLVWLFGSLSVLQGWWHRDTLLDGAVSRERGHAQY